MAEEELSVEDRQILQSLVGYGSQIPEGKESVFSFFKHVATADDTTKLGNLSEEELGIPRHPLRTFKNASLLAKNITDYPELADILSTKGEILTSTSLSKDALLVRLAVTQKRELADVTKTRKKNKGMFGFRKKDTDEPME